MEVIRDPERCLDGAVVAVLATEWDQFRKLKPEGFLKMRGREGGRGHEEGLRSGEVRGGGDKAYTAREGRAQGVVHRSSISPAPRA